MKIYDNGRTDELIQFFFFFFFFGFGAASYEDWTVDELVVEDLEETRITI